MIDIDTGYEGGPVEPTLQLLPLVAELDRRCFGSAAWDAVRWRGLFELHREGSVRLSVAGLLVGPQQVRLLGFAVCEAEATDGPRRRRGAPAAGARRGWGGRPYLPSR